MTLTLRIVLIVCSVFICAYAIHRIRAAKVDIGDTIFWIIFSLFLLFFSIFPNVMAFFARIIGIESPVDMVFFCVIALLGYKCLTLSFKVSALEMKLKTLAIDVALKEKEADERKA